MKVNEMVLPENLKKLEKEAEDNPKIRGTLIMGDKIVAITGKDIKIKNVKIGEG